MTRDWNRRFKDYIKGLIAYVKFHKGDLGKEYRNFSYGDLLNLSYFSKKDYLKLKNRIIEENKKRIYSRSKCKVGFVVYTTSMWSVDGLFRLMSDDKKFEPSVIVVPFADATQSTYQETKSFFIRKGYNIETSENYPFDVTKFDVIIYTNPYVAIDEYVNILNLRLDKLVSYVSYSYMLSDNLEKLDLPVYQLSWKYFCDSNFYKNLIETKSRIYSGNAVFCGYPKMDAYYSDNEKKSDFPPPKKIVIYAPHQSVNRGDKRYATFDSNGWYLLYLAEKYRDLIYWIVKPHPLLRTHSVKAGLFLNEEAYNDYLKKWEETGSARVVENGDYFDLFKESDAMVTDSVSFLAEYQFTGKPLLLLESGKQTYNAFGNSIRQILYKCSGNNYYEIECFLNNVLNEKDPMKEIRSGFFQKELSCGDRANQLACHNIYKIFKKELS